MIIIPEIKTVVICVPRTGTTSLKKAVKAAYPEAFLPYRHMEAHGTPHGYEGWAKVGVVRRPLERLWSLYRYCAALTADSPSWSSGRAIRMRESTEVFEFDDWLLHNHVPFCPPKDHTTGEVFPYYSVMHVQAENRKSQFNYLRPDLGTQVYRFEDQRDELAERLGVSMTHENAAPAAPMPYVQPTTVAQLDHLEWDAKYANGWSDRIPFPMPPSAMTRDYMEAMSRGQG